MSIRVLRSFETKKNPGIADVPRLPDESNLGWIARVLKTHRLPVGQAWSHLLLVGGADLLSLRLRIAQSHVRADLSPSAWSHSAYVALNAGDLKASVVRGVSLAPRDGFGKSGFAPSRNGMQDQPLADYDDANTYPNIGIIAMPVPGEKIETRLSNLEKMRNTFNVPELILRWLTYGWGVGVPSSPLADGFGVPGAAVLEAAYAAEQFDLTPGLESRSSCPEAIWQAARFWYGYQQERAAKLEVNLGRKLQLKVQGAFCARDRLVPDDEARGGRAVSPEPPVPLKPRGAVKRARARK